MTEFGKLTEEGYEHVRSIPQSAMLKCPHFIIMAEHYRSDNSCRCDDETHTEMIEWGYRWIDGRWIAPDDGYTRLRF
jgi:hypothetical protein